MLTREINKAFQGLEQPTIQQLKERIHLLEKDKNNLSSFATEPKQMNYGRNVIYCSDHVEVIVIHIPAGQKTKIHNHGNSIGSALVLEGEIVNVLYELDKYGYPEIVSKKRISENEFFNAPRGQIHEIRNDGKERVVSLHVYSPPLTNTKSYVPYIEVLDFVI